MRWKVVVWSVMLTSFIWGQQHVIDWGPEMTDHSSLVSILPNDGLNFFAFRNTYSGITTTSKITKYAGGEELLKEKINQRVGNNVANLEDIIYFGGSLIAFMSDKQDGSNNLYMIRYDEDLFPVGESVLIASYPLLGTFKKKGEFQIIVSENKQFLCAEYTIPAQRDEYEFYGFNVLDSSLNTIIRTEYEMPYISKLASVDTRYLSDKGEYFLGVSVFTDNNFGVWRDYSSLLKTVVVQVEQSGIHEFELLLDSKKVYDFELSVIDETLLVTGTYGEPFSSGARGVFYQNVDLVQNKIIRESIQEFPADLLNDEKEQNQYKEMDRKDYVSTQRFDDELMNYAFRGIHPMADGSITIVAEQFYIFQLSSSDGRGLTQSVNHYYYNDLLIYRIDSLGNVSWIIRVPKEQYSTNDYGYYSSMKSFVADGKLHCFFNDTRDNYDENGQFEVLKSATNFPMRPKKYVLAQVEVDITAGTASRFVHDTYETIQSYVVLKQTEIDLSKRQMLFYANGTKERFGMLQF
ncbi:MAG: hypothetical protein IT221_13455 [Fluviicola sp.]|nr:hypothetical protein [Fluviicola sp.]